MSLLVIATMLCSLHIRMIGFTRFHWGTEMDGDLQTVDLLACIDLPELHVLDFVLVVVPIMVLNTTPTRTRPPPTRPPTRGYNHDH